MLIRYLMALFCAVLLTGCALFGDRPSSFEYWGGEQAAMALGESGGWVDLDCAWGTIDAPLTLDRHGRFDVQGRHVDQPGPPPYDADPLPASRPVRYEGWVADGLLTLRVTVEGEATVGPFFLRRRTDPVLRRYCNTAS